MCEQDTTIPYQDGLDFYYFITKSPHSENEETNALLRYMQDSTQENATTELTRKLHELVTSIKSSSAERNRYMTWEGYIQYRIDEALEEKVAKGRAEGLAEGLMQSRREDILEALHALGELPKDIEITINQTTDVDKLKIWIKLANKVENISDFIDHME